MNEDDIEQIRARVIALPTLTTAERYTEMRDLIALIPELLDTIERLMPQQQYLGHSYLIPISDDYTGWVA